MSFKDGYVAFYDEGIKAGKYRPTHLMALTCSTAVSASQTGNLTIVTDYNVDC
jgi:hypothetical protein